MIKDSGNRRTFEGGAVRDIQEGKGRCDLLPLNEIAMLYRNDGAIKDVLKSIECFKRTGQVDYLIGALIVFKDVYENSIADMILEVAKHYEEGANKYAERNWEKGIPTHCYIDSATRHLFKHLRGDTDERHDRAFVWNILGCMWTIKNKPEYNDYPIEEVKNNDN